MKVPQKTFIETTDVKSDLQPAVEVIASVLNPFMEEIVQGLDGQLDFENLNQAKLTITVRVDGTGTPISGATFRNTLKLNKQVEGITVIRAINQTSPTTYPTGTPFISYSEDNKLVTIKNITNLTASQVYKLTLIIF